MKECTIEDLTRDSLSSTKQILFQIPVCSICLQELSRDITSLPCGHCFHFDCIEHHLKRLKNCPNCKHSSLQKDMRRNYYTVVEHSQTKRRLKDLMPVVDQACRQQVQILMKRYTNQVEQIQKLKWNLREHQNTFLVIQQEGQRYKIKNQEYRQDLSRQNKIIQRLEYVNQNISQQIIQISEQHETIEKRCKLLEKEIRDNRIKEELCLENREKKEDQLENVDPNYQSNFIRDLSKKHQNFMQLQKQVNNYQIKVWQKDNEIKNLKKELKKESELRQKIYAEKESLAKILNNFSTNQAIWPTNTILSN